MNDNIASRRLALAALLTAPLAAAGCARAEDDADAAPCPDLVGHKARFIGPLDAVTMDYSADRVNIHHDEDFVITKITWG